MQSAKLVQPFQVRAARSVVRLGVRELAEAAEVSPATVTRYENEHGGLNLVSLGKIVHALEAAGVEFIENGVRLKAPAQN